jgi:hypothetical protein
MMGMLQRNDQSYTEIIGIKFASIMGCFYLLIGDLDVCCGKSIKRLKP